MQPDTDTSSSLYIRVRPSWIEVRVPLPNGKISFRSFSTTGASQKDSLAKAKSIRDQIIRQHWCASIQDLASIGPDKLSPKLKEGGRDLNQITTHFGRLRMTTLAFLEILSESQFDAEELAAKLRTTHRNLSSQLSQLEGRGLIRQTSVVSLGKRGLSLVECWRDIRKAINPHLVSDPEQLFLSMKSSFPQLMPSAVAHLLLVNAGCYDLDHITEILGNSRPAATQSLIRLRKTNMIQRVHGGVADKPTDQQRISVLTKGTKALAMLFGESISGKG